MSTDIRTGAEPILTSLHRNPFYVLNVTMRDNRAKIVESAEEMQLVGDPETCNKARADLTHTRNRLAAEIAWLPGVAPNRAVTLVKGIGTHFTAIRTLTSVPRLAHANLMAAAFDLLDPLLPVGDIAGWILDLSKSSDEIDAELVARAINEDRSVAGFPAIGSADVVEAELEEQRKKYKEAIRLCLDRLPSSKLLDVMNLVAELGTNAGAHHASPLVESLVESYEVEAHSALTKGLAQIEELCAEARSLAPSDASALDVGITQIISAIQRWDRVAQPIQTCKKALGVEHSLSRAVVNGVRSLSIDLFNEHDLLEQTRRLNDAIIKHFSEYPETAERVMDDKRTLDEITESRKYSNQMAPILDICKEIREAAKSDPKNVDIICDELIESAPELLEKLSAAGAGKPQLNVAKDAIAAALAQGAIAYGNADEPWSKCLEILKAASHYAEESATQKHIDDNLVVVQRNARVFGNMTPVKAAPGLRSVNGIGLTVYGSSDKDAESGTYVTTHYLIFFAIPLLPLARYRVRRGADNSYYFLGKVPFRPFDKAHIAVAIALLSWAIFVAK